jgi:hypothetical protein
MFCLPKEFTSKFLNAIKDGTINPEKLIDMSSEERRSLLGEIVGKEHAKEVNAMLESKLLLKDQKRGMVSWAKRVAGITEATRNDMISRIEKMDRVLDASDQHSFLEDLASKKIGTDISFEEAKNVAALSRKVVETREAIKASDPVGSASRLDYGAKFVALQNYVHELKLTNSKASIAGIMEDVKQSPAGAAGKAISQLAGIAKGLKASFDNSFGGRQGFKAIFTNPTIWADNFIKSFGYIGKQLLNKASDNSVVDAVKADIFSRPNALDGTYKAMKLDVGLDTEEAYPSALPEHIPGIGRLYKASEAAYNGMAIRLRADIADQVIAMAKANDHDLTNQLNVESLGKLVNSLTGRGHLGSLEKVGKSVNALFFSPKSLKASFDFLTLHSTDEMSAYSRAQAGKNLLKVTAGIATIMAVSNALQPGSAELDPRGADFGKIRVGDTRFDISGGMLSLVTLASRILTMSSKSSTTGKVTPLNSGKFGSQNGLDVLVTFATNKVSPIAGVLLDLLKGQDHNGNKPSVVGEASNLLMPLPVSNVQELMTNPKAANPLLAEMADAIGFVTNTYSPRQKSTGK